MLARPAIGAGEVLLVVSTSSSFVSTRRTRARLGTTGAAGGKTGLQVCLVFRMSRKPDVVRRVDVKVERVVVVEDTTVVVFVMPGKIEIDVAVTVFVVVERSLKPWVRVVTMCVV